MGRTDLKVCRYELVNWPGYPFIRSISVARWLVVFFRYHLLELLRAHRARRQAARGELFDGAERGVDVGLVVECGDGEADALVVDYAADNAAELPERGAGLAGVMVAHRERNQSGAQGRVERAADLRAGDAQEAIDETRR